MPITPCTSRTQRSSDSQSTEREAGDSKEQKEVDCWLLRSDFYHGYIPREDTTYLLRANGDFLVRLSEKVKVMPDKQLVKETSNIISVLVDEENKLTITSNATERRLYIKHIVIYHRGGKWYLDDNLKFNSAALLFAHYMNTPLVINDMSILLQRGVRLCRWEYFHRNIKVIKTVGRGAYGEVKLAELHKRNGKVLPVAAKTISNDSSSPKKIKEMLKEARIMRSLQHPNIVSFLGVVLVDQPIYLILEFMEGGALDSYLRKNNKRVTDQDRLRFAQGVAWGMEYLHSVNILHRDLAARNCLYDGKCYVKIADFGLSKKGTEYKMKTMQKMPIKYMAPESLSRFFFSQKTDVYTYGVLIYEIYTCKEPYHDIPASEVKNAILAGKLNKLPDNVPSELCTFINEKMWNKDPTQRADFCTIVSYMEKLSGLKLTKAAFDEVSNMVSEEGKSKAQRSRSRPISKMIPRLRNNTDIAKWPGEAKKEIKS